jgi:hypothetical protein
VLAHDQLSSKAAIVVTASQKLDHLRRKCENGDENRQDKGSLDKVKASKK